jgi:glycerol-3-phosphate dehydrogenase
MKRNIAQLENKEYDLIVIGGGIFGACAAWDAVLRGLDVALIEKDDFCQGTSAHHFKMIHGGMRYLQHLDLRRVRESSRERSISLKTAPHLTAPLPILIPTYGHGMRGKEILRTGLLLYELITCDRNKDITDPGRYVPKSYALTKHQMLKAYPGIKVKNLTGGVVFYDGQIYNPPRLVVSYIRSAVNEGLVAANYVNAIDYIVGNNKIRGVIAQDRMSGEHLEIRSKFVLNAAGPWAHRLNERIFKKPPKTIPSFSRDLVMVVPKILSKKYAFAHVAESRDKDALFDRGGRHIFIVPWRGYSLIGVWHQVFNKAPEEITVSRSELQQFLDEVNHVYQNVDLTIDDISFINTGLILFGTEMDQGGKTNHSFGKRSMIVDHFKQDNLEGLITMIGVRATIARLDAQKTLDLISARINKKTKISNTEKTPIYGGRIDNFKEFCREAENLCQQKFRIRLHNSLLRNYGSEYQCVLKYSAEDPSLGQEIESTNVIKAEVIHAVRDEMAFKLQDVIFRRTELGTGKNPGPKAIEVCANLMAKELGWHQQKIEDEVNEVYDVFARKGPWRVV